MILKIKQTSGLQTDPILLLTCLHQLSIKKVATEEKQEQVTHIKQGLDTKRLLNFFIKTKNTAIFRRAVFFKVDINQVN